MHPNNYKRYQKQKRKSNIKNITIFIVLFIIGSAIAFFLIQQDLISNIPNEDNLADDLLATDELPPIIEEEIVEEVEEDIRAIYFNVDQANNSEYIGNIFADISSGKVNALVLPIKNADGSLNYVSSLDYTSVKVIEKDLTSIIAQAISEDVYLIAEFSAYNDHNYSRKYTNASFKTSKNVNWLDYQMRGWITPYSDEGNIYLTALIDELYTMGFDEILLNQFHFPVLGQLHLIYNDPNITKEDMLASRLEEWSKNYTVSLQVSPYVFMEEHIENSGQNIEKLAQYASKIYVNITDDESIKNYEAIEVENKAMISNSILFSTTETGFIVKQD